MTEKFYLTTAISYPNGKPHIGHAYEAIAADTLARFHSMCGREVCLVTGTDEHGLKMVQAARDAGESPLDFSDTMSRYFRDMCDRFAVSYTEFVRTSAPSHHRAAQALWHKMFAMGDIYLGRYEGWYSMRDEAFYDDSEIKIIDGVRFSPHDTEVEWTAEESWFFRLSKYEDRLLDHYEKEGNFIRPQSYYNEVLRFVEGGLKDICISRSKASLDWGVAIPTNPSDSATQDHVMYVWVDALAAYLTGVGGYDDKDRFKRYWPADLHLVGKDITRFHAVYWPAFLMSAGLPLPKQIFAHGFLLHRGKKMSKSLGNVVEPTALADKVGVDALRYYLLRGVVFGQDGGYSLEDIIQTTNSDLANGFGNLVQRCLSMIVKNMDDRLVDFERTEEDKELLRVVFQETQSMKGAYEGLALTHACAHWIAAVNECNKYIDEQAPWVLRKINPQRMQAVLMTLFLAIRDLTIAISPVIPTKATQLLDHMGIAEAERDFAALAESASLSIQDENPRWFARLVESGYRLKQPDPLFPRLDMPIPDKSKGQ